MNRRMLPSTIKDLLERLEKIMQALLGLFQLTLLVSALGFKDGSIFHTLSRHYEGASRLTRIHIKPDRLLRYEPNRRTARAWALAASISRFRGDAVVTMEPSRVEEARVISSTARLNAFRFAAEGSTNPVIFRTNCRAAIRISSPVAGGSKLYRVLIFLHTLLTSGYAERPELTAAQAQHHHFESG